MSASISNPKDLRDLVMNSKQKEEAQDSQLLVLRSRVEQQAELIMLLKQRADDVKDQLDHSQKDFQEVKIQNAKLSENLKEAVKMRDKVEKNFKTLSENHEQIIVLKDQYKAENEQMRKRVAAADEALAQHVAGIKKQQEAQIAALQLQLDTLTAEHALLKTSSEAKLAQAEQARKDAERQRDQLLHVKEKQDQAHAAALAKERTAVEQLTATKKKQEDEVVGLRGAVIEQDARLRDERGRVEMLKGELDAAIAKIGLLQSELDLARKDAMDAVAAQRKMSAELSTDSLSHKLASLTQEYAAFKKHSAELLAKEREINARLRHLSQK